MTAAPRDTARLDRGQPKIALAQGQSLEAAVARLIGAEGLEPGSIDRFMQAAQANGVDLSHMWASFDPRAPSVREVCLAVPGAGRSATVFTSKPATERREQELGRVVNKAVDALPGVAVAQALLGPEEEPVRRALAGAQWRFIADLDYMKRPLSRSDASLAHKATPMPHGVRTRRYRPGDDDVFLAALEASYVDTLDCPELCGLRTTEDVLASHKATGHFDPDLWWLIENDQQPAGVLLLNPSPEQGSVELVYIGLAPSVRQRGVGRSLLMSGLAELAHRTEREMTCAVDLRNAPARKLYESLGFTPFARRRAMVKPLRSA